MAGDVHHARGIWEKYHPRTPQRDVPPSTPKQVNPSRAVATGLRRQHGKSMKLLILLLCLAYWTGKGEVGREIDYFEVVTLRCQGICAKTSAHLRVISSTCRANGTQRIGQSFAVFM